MVHPNTRTPFISITDFLHHQEVRAMQNTFSLFLNEGQNRTLGVGVMTFGKMYRGEKIHWSETCPSLGNIAEVFTTAGPFNCLHYADFDPPPNVGEYIERAIAFGGPFVDAIQLDMCWPESDQIGQALRASSHPVEVILQVGCEAFEQISNDPVHLIGRLEDYENLIHRVLLDRSMGEGKEMDPQFLLPFFRAIRKAFPHLGLVAGGGLGPGTTHLIRPLHAEFPDMSYDAQGKLHPNRDLFQPIHWDHASQYLIEMLIATR